jgi:hypothetical protein
LRHGNEVVAPAEGRLIQSWILKNKQQKRDFEGIGFTNEETLAYRNGIGMLEWKSKTALHEF